MATVEPRHERNDPTAGQIGAYYTVDIAQSGFGDGDDANGGRCSPVAHKDPFSALLRIALPAPSLKNTSSLPSRSTLGVQRPTNLG